MVLRDHDELRARLLGFGLYRPGFTSGASLSVGPANRMRPLGIVTSVNGMPYIFGPPLGVALYAIWMPLPFILTGAVMLALVVWVKFRLSPSARAA
jgi:hypothetical protein